MIVNIELPFFPGFYESDLENCDTAYWAIKEELQYYQEECDTPCPELTEDDLDFNYSDYEEECARAWVDGWLANAPEIVLSAKDCVIDRPKKYNFRNDRIYADVELRDDWQEVMQAFIWENTSWLKKLVADEFTSYDGYMSFMSDDLGMWGSHLFLDKDERYIGSMLGFMMYAKNKNIRNDLVMYALEDIYAPSYAFLTESGKEKVDEVIKKKESMRGQLEIPFEWD